MRKLVTGVDSDGRSCLAEVTGVELLDMGGHGVNLARILLTDQSPPPPRLPALGRYVETSLAPGLLRWMIVEHPPHDENDPPTTSRTMHHNDALDLVFVHEGTGNLLLQDGPHPVGPGDLIVMHGVDHAMDPGADGMTLVVFSIGVPPPPET